MIFKTHMATHGIPGITRWLHWFSGRLHEAGSLEDPWSILRALVLQLRDLKTAKLIGNHLT